jgi:hypothetical protein
MKGEFFEMLDDMKIRARRFGSFASSTGEEILLWDCRYGRTVEWVGPVHVKLLKDGLPLDLSANSQCTWIASPRARQVLESVAPAAVQYIPLNVPGGSEPYFIANIIKRVACLDEKMSLVERWQPNNPIRPDLVGQVSTVIDLHIDPARAAGEHLFRLDEKDFFTLVSKKLKEALEQAGITGLKFQSVTSPDIAPYRIEFARRQPRRNAT